MISLKKIALLFLSIITTGTLFAQTDYQAEVYFNLDKFYLRKDAIKKLDSICDKFKKMDSLKITLSGHCDSLGSIAYNEILSKKRATAIKNYMQKHGVQVSDANWFGETIPEYNKEKSFLNRRVQIKIELLNKPKAVKGKNGKPPFDPTNLADWEGLKKGSKVVLQNINFVLNKTSMVGDSITPLKVLFEFMSKYPGVRVRIEGHVCCHDDQPLSARRAQKIKNIMIKQGIPPFRIETAGYGNSRKLVVERTAQDQQINRRIEVEILSR